MIRRCRLGGLCVLAFLVGSCGAGKGDVLEETNFLRGLEGWSIGVEGKKGKVKAELEVDKGMKRVIGGDEGDVSWYFVAPPKVHV
jgi:hypothetical protein